MTEENAKFYVPLVQALAEKRLQTIDAVSREWVQLSSTSFVMAPEHYRRKPEPKLRPWKPVYVPVGALYRGQSWHPSERALIVHTDGDKVVLGGYGAPFHVEETLEGLYSTDGGKTWLPCGVLE